MKQGNAGFSMIEIVVATGVFAGVMVIAMTVSLTTTKSVDEGTNYIKSALSATKVMDRLAEELASAQYSSVTVSTPSGCPPNSYISFKKIVGYDYSVAPNVMTLATTTTVIRWVPNEGPVPGSGYDGIDNDDDGVVDDGRIVREEYTAPGGTLLLQENLVTDIERDGLVFTKIDPTPALNSGMLGYRVRVYLKNYRYAPDKLNVTNTNTDRVNGRTFKKAISQDYETVVSLRNK